MNVWGICAVILNWKDGKIKMVEQESEDAISLHWLPAIQAMWLFGFPIYDRDFRLI